MSLDSALISMYSHSWLVHSLKIEESTTLPIDLHMCSFEFALGGCYVDRNASQYCSSPHRGATVLIPFQKEQIEKAGSPACITPKMVL